MPFRQLTDMIINQIAAGEVVERPASVVKELVENALDAGAISIEVATAGGGLGLIRVLDDGAGIPAGELALAVSRHCTSKLDSDINAIHTLGFRGEALPSIGSVARLSIRSRVADSDSGAEIRVEGGSVSPMRPVGANRGTMVEVRDLFFATPARLKFMKGPRAESAAITDIVKRMAIAFPHVRFTVSGTDRSTFDIPPADGDDAQSLRIAQILGAEFVDNALAVDAEREGVRLTGLISIPSYSRATAQHQYAFVNGRPVRDKLIAGAIRGAFADVLPRDRHAVTALFIWLDPADVDVNVHPAKSDVRFRDAGKVRGLIVGATRETLAASGIRASTSASDAMINAFRPTAANHYAPRPSTHNFHQPLSGGFHEAGQALFESAPMTSARPVESEPDATFADTPLGAARAQIHENYIVSQTLDSLVIVDQHAAHERLVYETLKNGLESRPVAAQMLLLPEIVDLPEEDAERLCAHASFLAQLGLGVERFGPGAVSVRETPAMLGETDAQSLIRDLADEIADNDTTETLRERLNKVAATMACHGSVRSGRRMRPEEMNALLREMEATPGSGTCNHGRPTYIELKLTDIERLFGRR